MRTLVIAPHPDDELLGCGGTMLRRKAEGVTLGWLVMTSVDVANGWPAERVASRAREIQSVAAELGVEAPHVFQLGLPTMKLDAMPLGDVIKPVSAVIHDFQPNELLVPHSDDAHSDHRVTFDAAVASTKWFRYPSITRVMSYETLSETDAMPDTKRGFQPNVFVDISRYIERKWELLQIYESEMGDFPFPRSEKAVRALASVRGAQSGFEAAEAFCLLRERQV